MSLPKNILYLTYDGLTDSLGQSQILPYLTGLSKLGYSFTIISFEKQQQDAPVFLKVKASCEQHKIDWVALRYHKHPPVLSTCYDLYQLRKTTKRLHKEKKFDVVHCRSYITALIGLWLKRKYGVKFIFDMRGFWADERIDGGLWSLKNPLFKIIYSFFKRKERQFLNESDVVVSLTNNAKKEIQSWRIDTPIVVIPCCVDTKLFDPNTISDEHKQKIRSDLKLRSSDLVLLYLGSWGTWYMTDDMLAFFSKLKEKHPHAKLLIVSTSKPDLNDYAYKEDVIVRAARRDEVPGYISIAKASIFFIKPAFSKKASSATKMGEILAMNVPVITNPGWGDVQEMEGHSLIHFHQNVILQNFDFNSDQPTRSYCEEYLSLEVGVDRYASIYRNLSTGNYGQISI